MGAVSIIWTVLVMALNPAQNVLGDSISALGFAICFYYGFTGLACIIYFRRELFKSVRNFLLAGVAAAARLRDARLRLRQGVRTTTRRPASTTRRRSSASRCRS